MFLHIVSLLTITSNLILESVKTWAYCKIINYKNFLQIDASLYWIVNSIFDTTLNLPTSIHNIFVANISSYYETIPLEGSDNLFQAISFIVSIAYKQASLLHLRAYTNM